MSLITLRIFNREKWNKEMYYSFLLLLRKKYLKSDILKYASKKTEQLKKREKLTQV